MAKYARAYACSATGTATFGRTSTLSRTVAAAAAAVAHFARALTCQRATTATAIGAAAFGRVVTLFRGFDVVAVVVADIGRFVKAKVLWFLAAIARADQPRAAALAPALALEASLGTAALQRETAFVVTLEEEVTDLADVISSQAGLLRSWSAAVEEVGAGVVNLAAALAREVSVNSPTTSGFAAAAALEAVAAGDSSLIKTADRTSALDLENVGV